MAAVAGLPKFDPETWDFMSNEQLIPVEVAAKLLEISAERLRQLRKEGYVEFPERGKTTLVSAVRGYIRFLKDAAAKETKTSASARTQDAKTRLLELQLQEKERELIPQEDAQLAMQLLVGSVSTVMDTLPARITRDMEWRVKVEDEVRKAKGQIADALGKLSGALADGRDIDEAGSKART